MQFQIQELVKRQKEEVNTEVLDSLDLYVSLKSGLDDPFTIFIRVEDIINRSPNLYFYAYSIGKKKIMIWGIYDLTNNQFLIDHSCRFAPNDLKGILDTWKSHQYEFYYTAARNRSTSRIYQNLLFDDRNKELKNFASFKNYFMAKLIRGGVLSMKVLDLSSDVSNSDQKIIRELVELTENADIEDFEEDYKNMVKQISRKGLKTMCSEYKRDETEKYKDMMNLIYDNIEFSDDLDVIKEVTSNCKVQNFDQANKSDYIWNVVKYSLANIYILVFLDMEEYRIAKYIDYIMSARNSETKEQSKLKQLKSYIVGKFFYEWILELARILRVDDNKAFMKDYVKIILKYTEQNVNVVGELIGAKSTLGNNPELQQMSIFFENFISKSEFSKISVVNDIEVCPSVDVCEFGNNEACGIYNFGTKEMRSKFDML
jgi:hypothetical protein